MGLAYYRVTSAVLEDLQPLIAAHESAIVGPRARGYWFDSPDDFDYVGVQATARQLDAAGQEHGLERLELSEVQAHSLTLLEIELPADDGDFPPSLFAGSVAPGMVQRSLKIAKRRLGSSPEAAISRFAVDESDPLFADYLNKQLRHLREALPLVWRFHERAAAAGDAVLVVDLRARDLEIPEALEVADLPQV